MNHRSVECAIALGGNLGTVEQRFTDAIQQLIQHSQITVTAVSRNYVTHAVGTAATGDFLNAAVVCETTLSAQQMLEFLFELEQHAGRTREIKWGSRTLDLDLIYYGTAEIQTDSLSVPHPAMWYRRFVLDPLNEIAPTWQHPKRGQSIAQFYESLTQPDRNLLFWGEKGDWFATFEQQLKDQFDFPVGVQFLDSQQPFRAEQHKTVQMIIDIRPQQTSESDQQSHPRQLPFGAVSPCNLQDLLDLMHSMYDVPQVLS